VTLHTLSPGQLVRLCPLLGLLLQLLGHQGHVRYVQQAYTWLQAHTEPWEPCTQRSSWPAARRSPHQPIYCHTQHDQQTTLQLPAPALCMPKPTSHCTDTSPPARPPHPQRPTPRACSGT
jgi:hypothetical protein